jgi:hypothetical protein
VELGRYDETFLYSPRGGVAPFANISTTTLPAAWNIEGFEYFSVWLNNNFTSRGGAQKLVTNEADREMKDPRIRPFTVAEVKHVRDFFALGEECSKAQAIRDVSFSFACRIFCDSSALSHLGPVEGVREWHGRQDQKRSGKIFCFPRSQKAKSTSRMVEGLALAAEQLNKSRCLSVGHITSYEKRARNLHVVVASIYIPSVQ